MARGGRRAGAGRPKGSGKYGEPTRAVRLPQSLADTIVPFLDRWKLIKTQGGLEHVGTAWETLIGYPDQVQVIPLNENVRQLIPLYSHSVAAGLPASVESGVEETLDLNAALTEEVSRSFCVRANGDSMIDAGIHDGDLMIVDTSIEVRDNHIVIAVVNNELTVKRLRQAPEKVWLQPENPEYPIIEITEDTDFRVIGIVTACIRQFIRTF